MIAPSMTTFVPTSSKSNVEPSRDSNTSMTAGSTS